MNNTVQRKNPKPNIAVSTKYVLQFYLHEKSCLVGVICDHVIINFDFVAFTVLLEQKSDAVSTDFVLGLYGTNKALSSWGFDMKGCKQN